MIQIPGRIAAGCLGLGWLWLVGCGTPPPEPLPSVESCLDLEEGGGGEPLRLLPHGSCYQFSVEAGEAARLEIEQLRGDLVVTLVKPDGRALLAFDTPVDDDAPERPCLIADEPGTYQVRLSASDPEAEAAVRLLALRRATAGDRACAEASWRFMAAMEELGKGNTPQVAEELSAVADLWRVGEDPLSEAMARRSAARVWRDLAEYPKAEAALQQALGAARQAKNRYLELSVLNRLGVVFWYRGALEEAETVLFETVAVARAYGEPSGEATAYNNLALVDATRGNLTGALRRLRQAEAIQRERGLKRDLASTLQNIALYLSLRGHTTEAFRALDEAETLARETHEETVRIDCLLTRGWIHRLRNEPDKAEAPIRAALEFWRSKGDLVSQATALDRLGTVLSELGDLQGAEAAYLEALEIVSGSTPLSDLAPTFASLGCIHQEAGELDEARQWLGKARKAYEGVDDPISLAHLEYCTSQVAKDSGDLETALGHLQKALDIVEDLKTLDRNQGVHHRPISLWQDYAEQQAALWIALSEERQDPDLLKRAFSTADYARARSLFELVWESQLPEGRAREVEEALQDRLRELAEQRRLLRDAGEIEEAAALEDEAAALALELQEHQAIRRESDLGFATLPKPEPVSVEAIRGLLSPGDVLLRYFLAEPHSFLFILDRETLTVLRLASRPVLEAHAMALHQAAKESFHDPEPAAQLAHTVAEQLLPEGALPKGIRTLWLVPDGALHYVSFAALEPLETQPLVENYTLRYLPSAGVGVALDTRAKRRSPASLSLALFADPIFSTMDDRLPGVAPAPPAVSGSRGAVVERLPTGPLPRLRYTAQEAEAILALVPRSQRLEFLEFDATKAAAQDPVLQQYRILHFATHAFVDEAVPELSGLVLSRFDAGGNKTDGDLYLHEIFALRFRADLAVLSGCQTALGRNVRGDGLLGMTRGFFHAGASQLLVSLWSVDDEATATLMTEFYRALLVEGQGSADALRTAQRRLRENPRWKAPFYWAPFVLQGVEPDR